VGSGRDEVKIFARAHAFGTGGGAPTSHSFAVILLPPLESQMEGVIFKPSIPQQQICLGCDDLSQPPPPGHLRWAERRRRRWLRGSGRSDGAEVVSERSNSESEAVAPAFGAKVKPID